MRFSIRLEPRLSACNYGLYFRVSRVAGGGPLTRGSGRGETSDPLLKEVTYDRKSSPTGNSKGKPAEPDFSERMSAVVYKLCC